MKLSEAIREGCKYSPKIKGSRHEPLGACALGAAEDAYRGRSGGWTDKYVEIIWPWACSHKEPLPMDYFGSPKGAPRPVVTVIACLNNQTEMSREAISEWVETVERKLGMWDEPKVDAPVVQEAIKASMETVKTFSGG